MKLLKLNAYLLEHKCLFPFSLNLNCFLWLFYLWIDDLKTKTKKNILIKYSFEISCTFLTCLFRRKCQATSIVIARSSFSCKNFNADQYSKNIKDINTKHGKLAFNDKARAITPKAIFLSYAPFHLNILSRIMAPDRQALVPHAVLLLALLFQRKSWAIVIALV